MKRTIINIDEEKCDGCGNCVEGCHEGALQIIDEKARLVSELFCDGLGACIGECPQGAITLEEREAQPYDEIAVMERISGQGENTVIAHMKHLRDHNEMKYFNQAIDYIKENNIDIDLTKLSQKQMFNIMEKHSGGGCPGSKSMDFGKDNSTESSAIGADQPSALNQWPVQMHLVNPGASYFQNSDVLLAADCVAFSMGNFHSKFLKGKSLAIACPKLDSNMEVYIDKLTAMIDESNINTLTVMIMEVPCCGGLLRIAQTAMQNAERKIPLKLLVVGIRGDILSEQWIMSNN
ncbi:MAG: 4Fe-4S binding protein [Ignavibacteriae bacterium]|nr:4Fe-4S binding protein [Ignavibacteriota bacterium]